MFGKKQKFNDGEEKAPEAPSKKAAGGLFGLSRLLQRKTEETASPIDPTQKPKPKPKRRKSDAANADLTAEILKVAAESQQRLPSEQVTDTLLLEGVDDELHLPAGSTATPPYAFDNQSAEATQPDLDAIVPADGFHIGHPSIPATTAEDPLPPPSISDAIPPTEDELPAEPLLTGAAEPPVLLLPPHEDLLLAAINRHLDSVQAEPKKEREPVLHIDPVSAPAITPEDFSPLENAAATQEVPSPALEPLPPLVADAPLAGQTDLPHEDQFLAAIEAHLATSPVSAIGPVVSESPAPAGDISASSEAAIETENPTEAVLPVVSSADEVLAAPDQPLPAANETLTGETVVIGEITPETQILTPESDVTPFSETASSDEAVAAQPIGQSSDETRSDPVSNEPASPALIIPGLENSPTAELLFAGPPVDSAIATAIPPEPESTTIPETATETRSEPDDSLHIADPAQVSIAPLEAIEPEVAPLTADQPEAGIALNSENSDTLAEDSSATLPAGPPSAGQTISPHADDVLAAIEQHLDAGPPAVVPSAAADQDLVSAIINTAQSSTQATSPAPEQTAETPSPSSPQPEAKPAGKLLTGIEDALLNDDLPVESPVAAEPLPLATEPLENAPAPAKGIGGWFKRNFRKKAAETPAPVNSATAEPAAGESDSAVAEASTGSDHAPENAENNPPAVEGEGPERNLVHLYQSLGLSESEVAAAAKAQGEGPANTELISAIIETAKKSQEERTKVLGGEFTDQVSIEAAEVEKKKLRHERLILISRFCAGFSLIVPICSWIVFQAVLDSDSKISSMLKAENHGAVHAVLQTKKIEKENQLGVISKEISVIKEQTASIRENKIIKGIMDQRVDFLGIMLRVNETTLKALNLTPDLNNAIHMLVFNSYTGRLENGNASITISGTVRDPKRLSISKLTYLIESINGDDHFNGVELRTFAKSDDELGGTQSAFNFNFKFFPKTDAVETTLKAAAPAKKKKKK